jgi:hypothetical protein
VQGANKDRHTAGDRHIGHPLRLFDARCQRLLAEDGPFPGRRHRHDLVGVETVRAADRHHVDLGILQQGVELRGGLCAGVARVGR